MLVIMQFPIAGGTVWIENTGGKTDMVLTCTLYRGKVMGILGEGCRGGSCQERGNGEGLKGGIWMR